MSKKAGTALSVMAMVFMGALASPLTVLAADAEETYQPALYATIWALGKIWGQQVFWKRLWSMI